MRALPSWVLSNLLAHKVAQVGAKASHERRSRSDAIGVKSILADHFSLPYCLCSSLPIYKVPISGQYDCNGEAD